MVKCSVVGQLIGCDVQSLYLVISYILLFVLELHAKSIIQSASSVVYKSPHLTNAYQQFSDNLPTAYQRLPTTYQQLTNSLPTAYQQLANSLPRRTNSVPTAYRQLNNADQQFTDNIPTLTNSLPTACARLPRAYQQLTNSLPTGYQELFHVYTCIRAYMMRTLYTGIRAFFYTHLTLPTTLCLWIHVVVVL